MDSHPPIRIETERLVLRAWTVEDAEMALKAVEESRDHLKPWMPWAHNVESLEDVRARHAESRRKFLAGEDFTYGVFNREETAVWGGTGLHPRIGPNAIEIGYWIHVDQVGRGLATELSRALTEAALSTPGIDRVEIRCDPENHVSAAIPKKLGYVLIDHLVGNAEDAEGNPRDTLVFEMKRP